MPNAILTKHDGTITSIPADSVVAILATALDAPNEQKPMLRSIVMSTFRGLTGDFLQHTADDAATEIEKARSTKRGALLRSPKPKEWLMLDCGDDVTRLLPGSVPGYETISEERLRIYWARPTGDPVPLDVNNTPENLARLDADIEGA